MSDTEDESGARPVPPPSTPVAGYYVPLINAVVAEIVDTTDTSSERYTALVEDFARLIAGAAEESPLDIMVVARRYAVGLAFGQDD